MAQWSSAVNIPNQFTKAAPCLTVYGSTVLNYSLQLLHLGDSSNKIWHSTYAGAWSDNLPTGLSSHKTPTLVLFGQGGMMIYLAEGTHQIAYSMERLVPGPGPLWESPKLIPRQYSKESPVALASNYGIEMVHSGDSSNSLWSTSFSFSTRSWSQNFKIPNQSSQAPPALAMYRGEVHMVHVGDGSSRLWHSRLTATGWTPNVVIADQTSKTTPALAEFGGKLHMVHLGGSSNDLWHSAFDGVSWTPNVRIQGQASQSAPALAAYQDALHLVYRGNSSNKIWHSQYR